MMPENNEMQDQDLNIEDVKEPEQAPRQENVLETGLLAENKRLQNLYSQSQTQLAHLLGDPSVRTLLQAAKDGKNFKVVVDEPNQQPDLSDSGVDDEVDDNLSPKDIFKKLSSKLESIVKSKVDPVISQKATIFEDQLTKLSSAVQAIMQEKATNSFQAELAKNPDMKNYMEPMREIIGKNPDLSFSEAYFIAKSRAGHVDPIVSSGERPNTSVRKLNPKDWTNADNSVNLNKKIALIADQLLSQNK